METLKAIKIIGNHQNDGRAVFLFLPNTARVTKGFKFHARPQTGAYSCYILKEASTKVLISINMKEHRLGFPKIGRDSRFDLRSPSTARTMLPTFVIFKRNCRNILRTNHGRLRSTRPQICLSGLALCIMVDLRNSLPFRAPKMTSLNVQI